MENKENKEIFIPDEIIDTPDGIVEIPSESILFSEMGTSRATSGTIVNNFRTGYKVQAVWSVNSQNVANNTSNVTVQVQLCSTGSSYSISSSATKNGSVTINGTTYSFTFSAGLSGNQTKTVYTKTVDIPHNSDGTKSFSISATLGIAVTLSGTYWGNVTCSGTASLNSIPRTSTMSLSASSIEAGKAITVNITRASSSFTHKVYYSFGSNTATISTSATTSASYTIPLSHLSAIPNSTSGTATISVDTYNGSTYIGSVSKNFTITAPSSVKPTISSITATVVANGADTSYGYVKGKSKCKLVINGATGSYGSSIKSYAISGGGFSGSSSTFTTGALNTAGNVTFTATVTDSRGRKSDAKTVTINVLDYTNPNITGFNVIRCNSSGTADDNGTYLKIWTTYTYSTLGGKNTLTTKAEFKKTSASTWTNAGAIASGNSIITGSNGIATDSSYDVRFTITDNFSPISKAMVVPTAFVTMDFKKGGKGIAFGKVSETNNLLDIGMNTKISGTTTFDGDIKMESPDGTYTANFIKRFGANDEYGMGIAIQSGGKMAIGGGESANTFLSSDGNLAQEHAYLTADSNTYLVSNLNGGYDSRKHMCFANSGQLSFSDSSCHIQLPNNGGSWLNGATNGNIRGTKQSTGSYHPIISQTTSSNHKISLGGLGDEFGFHMYDASRTENGIDKYFRFRVSDKTIRTDCRIFMDEWLYLTGGNGVYFSTHGGGWYMNDATWIRAYGNKNIYTSGTVRSGTADHRYIKGNSGGTNTNLDLITYDGTAIFMNPNSGSGASIQLDRAWSGNSGTEPSFRNNKGNGWGFIGNSGTSFYRVYGAGGSVSDRNKKYEILKADTETQYENIKNLNIYNYRTISTQDTSVEELAEIFFNANFIDENQNYITKSIEIDGKKYKKISDKLPIEEIKRLRIEEIIENNPNFGECKREDLSLGCMIDEMPLETTFYDNEGGDGKAVDMYSYTTMVLGATKHLITKVETLEKENEELRNRLDKMEEMLNGIINKG